MEYFVNVFLLWHFCVAQLSEVSQPVSFQTVQLGDSATVQCHIKSQMKKRVWYKLTTGKRLQFVAAFNYYFNRTLFANESHQYSVDFDRVKGHLRISATKWEDAGIYFCGVMNLNDVQFGQGTSLMIKGANMISDSVVQHPESQSVPLGESVTLSCSVHASEHCADEHTSVMWIRVSHHSAPQMIYSSRNTDKACRRMQSGQTSCLYEFLMKKVISEDAGICYCVVTSCGQIRFGNGTRIDVHNTEPFALSPTVIALMLSNIILGTVTLFLLWKLFRNQRKHSTEDSDRCSETNQAADEVTYASVCPAPRRQTAVKRSGDSVVYSDIRHCQQYERILL